MELKLLLALAALLATVIYPSSASGANISVDAKDEELWNGTAFVIVAEIIDVQHSEGEPTQYYHSTIRPIVCLAGLFNPAAHPEIRMEFAASAGRPVWIHPKAGNLVLAVIYDRTKLGVPQSGFSLANGQCWFMPGNQPLLVLKGMGDPAILQVLHNMQAARPTTAPTTQPHRHP